MAADSVGQIGLDLVVNQGDFKKQMSGIQSLAKKAGAALASAFAVFRRRGNPQFFQRRVSADTVSQAATILMMYLSLFLLGALVISRMEDLPILTCLFETASAIGTVGLTLGVTPQLNEVSRLILIALMYFGRVGGLTLIYAALSNGQGSNARLPQERITVG